MGYARPLAGYVRYSPVSALSTHRVCLSSVCNVDDREVVLVLGERFAGIPCGRRHRVSALSV